MPSIAERHFGFSKSPGTPSTWLRSAGPTKIKSTSGTRAISATEASAEGVSIWIPTNVSAFAWRAYSAIGVRP